METQKKRMILTAVIAAAVGLPITVRGDNDFGSTTPFYEDDAWYDVSEWFDGNDYNPTDEAIGRWDDEVFTFADNATSSDSDNDWNSYGDFGYNQDPESDWFYDYYDDGYRYWADGYYSSYYDTDDDGLYDAVSQYSDIDDDGFYEEFKFYTFDSQAKDQARSKQQAKAQQKLIKSTTTSVSGRVTGTKMVTVRDRVHLVAMVEQSDGEPIAVDLGPNQSEVQLFKGDKLNAAGHVVKIGNKPVLIANKASMQNGTIGIDRNGRKYQGTIKKIRPVNVRGRQHEIAKVKIENGKSMMADLGPTENLEAKIGEGTEVTLQGVPVKVKDRVVLMAHQITRDGKKMKISRQ